MNGRGERLEVGGERQPPAETDAMEANPYQSPQINDEPTTIAEQRLLSRLQIWLPMLMAAAVPIVLDAVFCWFVAFDVEAPEERLLKFLKTLPVALLLSAVFAASAAGFVLERSRRKSRKYSLQRLRDMFEARG